MRRHPAGLYVLFVTEMWERFSFYSMVNLLSLYTLSRHDLGGLGFSREVTSQIYGLYNAFIYFTPLLGGLVADRWWGFIRTIMLGGVAMMAGHLALAFDGLGFFFAGLVLLIIGNGLFKPNISVMLGNLYDDRKELKDRGFSIFYMGINLGAMFGTLTADFLKNRFVVEGPESVASTVGASVMGPLAAASTAAGNLHAPLGHHYGWHYAFGAASLGMLVSLVLFAACRRWILVGERPVDRPKTAATQSDASPEVERLRVQALLIIFAVVIFFWMAFRQNGLTLTFWAREHTEPFLGIDFKHHATVTLVINPILIVVLTPLVVLMWNGLRRLGWNVTTAQKIMMGMLLTAGAFLVMAAAGLSGGDEGKVHVAWLFAGYFLMTVAELCISPMGLSVVSKLAPARLAGLLMGGWFASTATGNYLSGLVGMLWDKWPHSWFFTLLAGCCLGAAAVLALFMRMLERALEPPPALVVAVVKGEAVVAAPP